MKLLSWLHTPVHSIHVMAQRSIIVVPSVLAVARAQQAMLHGPIAARMHWHAQKI